MLRVAAAADWCDSWGIYKTEWTVSGAGATSAVCHQRPPAGTMLGILNSTLEVVQAQPSAPY